MFRVILIMFFCLGLLIGCGSPRPQRTQEEIREQEEREAQDQGTDYKRPDGAFGAKDFANEAKQSSDQSTEQAESAVENTDD